MRGIWTCLGVVVLLGPAVVIEARAELPRLDPAHRDAAEAHKRQARAHARRKDELLATAQWRAAAELGDAEAQYTLARRLEKGLGVMPYPEMLEAARREAATFDAAALAQSYGPAVERVEKEAARGSGAAQADFAMSLERQGRWEDAVDYYRAAFIQDTLSPVELVRAAAILVQGHIEPEPGEVEALYRRAMARGSAEAEVGLARAMFEGLAGVKRDPPAARRLLERGAGDGRIPAAMDLGRRYEEGDGVARDHARALQVYKRARHQDARMAEARLLLEGEVRRDPSQAIGALAEPARAGHFPAVDKLLDLASEGHVDAQLVVADMYLRGQGIEQDAAEAAHWYEAAAERQSPAALFALGQMYMRGDGVPRDPETARRYYARAHQAGSREAGRALGR
ncbi:MAG: sel1 repeat family protein [Deltaproteobacteria bacterium]|nr:sel1 repeat family protein [Deltaproteobacteria bacterium]